ncbi:MAG: putative sulfate exporter family transporter [Candidatus Sericytochromatia bacterium]|nr:putative sulfate exporter family transporter [Candidatus Sericytochromatia bacterium]
MSILRHNAPGLLLCFAIAALALSLAPYLPLNSLMLALLMGLLLAAFWHPSATVRPGVVFSMKKVLRLAIVLLGLRISLDQVQALGWSSLLIVFSGVALTFGLTLGLGRWLKLSRSSTLLMASGVSICGASAVLAADAVVEAEESDVVYAVAVITLLGTAFMLAYPVLQWLLMLAPTHYSLWVGSSVHEVAQVVAAGFAHGEQTGELATVVKLTRVLALVPVMLLLVVYQRRTAAAEVGLKQVPIPWFVLGFVGLLLLGGLLPASFKAPLNLLGQLSLVMAMAALGLETRLDKLRAAGLRPLYLGLASSLFLSLFSLGMIYALQP